MPDAPPDKSRRAAPAGSPRAPRTRIQERNRQAILGAALEVFSAQGFRGATLDRIAAEAGLSKPNLLYYFPSKAAIHEELLSGLMDTWLQPLRALDPNGDPRAEILTYVRRKLEMSRTMPRESRLFANEVLQGAPNFGPRLHSGLKPLVDEKAAVIAGWAAEGRIAEVDPHHLIFSIWATTQHYADFEAQIATLLPGADPMEGAGRHLERLFCRLLAP